MKEFADDNFKSYEMVESSQNGWKTLLGKEKLQRFLLCPQSFQKTSAADTKKTRVCSGKGYDHRTDVMNDLDYVS